VPLDNPSQASPQPTDAVTRQPASQSTVAEQIAGATLLLSDVRVAFMLANHARHRAIERLFGVTPAQSNLATLIVLALLADKGWRRSRPSSQGPRRAIVRRYALGRCGGERVGARGRRPSRP
jgi:hypothetical protein